MTAAGFALFDTGIGRCGIAWGAAGVVLCVQLPEERDTATRARLRRRFPDAGEAAAPPPVRRAQAAIAALLRGEPADLAGIALDMSAVPEFHRRVYEVARAIPAGQTLSYGAVASRLGAPGAARAVGQALGRNPFAIVVPCHRVLAAGGRVGGFSANGGAATKLRLLALEGAAPAAAAPTLFGGAAALDFDTRTAVQHLRASDAALARLIDAVGPCTLRIEPTPSVFLALAEAIIYQQLSGKAAATIFARVSALFPRSRNGPTPSQLLDATDEQLRGAGVSRPKLLALRDLARRAADGEIPTLAALRRMDDAAIVERLTTVRGIGRWTVQMLLIFRLGRPDVLPVDDYGVRKGFALTLRKAALPSQADLEKRGARWAPYRRIASWYLWRALDKKGT